MNPARLLRLPGPAPATESLYFRSQSFFASVLHDMDRARSSIDIEVYTWAADEVGGRFFRTLADAILRGVQVRLLVDGIGSFYWLQTQADRFREAGILVKAYHSVGWAIAGIRARKLLHALNRRDHRKLFLVDGRIAYTGSMNVTKSSFEWRETGIRVTGQGVRLLQDIFEDTWSFAEERGTRRSQHRSYYLQSRILQSPQVRCNQYFRLRKDLKADLLRRIDAATARIWITTPYFVPPVKLTSRLMFAARRGVDVRFLLPRRIDVPFLRWIARLYYGLLLSSGVRIFEFLPSILHAKTMIIDDWASVGSSNLNRRSHFLDLELDIVLQTPEGLERIATQFENDIAEARDVKLDKPLQGWSRFVSRIFFRLRHWC